MIEANTACFPQAFMSETEWICAPATSELMPAHKYIDDLILFFALNLRNFPSVILNFYPVEWLKKSINF